MSEVIGDRTVDADEPAFGVLEINVVRQIVEQRPQQVAFLFKSRFRFLAVGHVPENGLHADDVSRGVPHGRFHHLDVPRLAALCIPLDIFEQLAGRGHPNVVLAVFFRQLAGIEIEVRLAEDLLGRLAEQLAERLAGEGESPLEVLAENLDGEVLDEGRIKGLGIADFLFRPAALGLRRFQLGIPQPKFAKFREQLLCRFFVVEHPSEPPIGRPLRPSSAILPRILAFPARASKTSVRKSRLVQRQTQPGDSKHPPGRPPDESVLLLGDCRWFVFKNLASSGREIAPLSVPSRGAAAGLAVAEKLPGNSQESGAVGRYTHFQGCHGVLN